MKQNIIVVLFNISSEAYQAFSELKAYSQITDALVAQAVLIKKENGLIIPAESTDFTANTVEGAWTGSLIGSLVGILGGPIGVLLGGATGALIGSDVGTAQTLGEGLLLENTAKKLDNGSTGIRRSCIGCLLPPFQNRYSPARCSRCPTGRIGSNRSAGRSGTSGTRSVEKTAQSRAQRESGSLQGRHQTKIRQIGSQVEITLPPTQGM